MNDFVAHSSVEHVPRRHATAAGARAHRIACALRARRIGFGAKVKPLIRMIHQTVQVVGAAELRHSTQLCLTQHRAVWIVGRREVNGACARVQVFAQNASDERCALRRAARRVAVAVRRVTVTQTAVFFG